MNIPQIEAILERYGVPSHSRNLIANEILDLEEDMLPEIQAATHEQLKSNLHLEGALVEFYMDCNIHEFNRHDNDPVPFSGDALALIRNEVRSS